MASQTKMRCFKCDNDTFVVMVTSDNHVIHFCAKCRKINHP